MQYFAVVYEIFDNTACVNLSRVYISFSQNKKLSAALIIEVENKSKLPQLCLYSRRQR